MSDFIPNAFQTPNAYADQFMHLLTSDEWKVLSYACRRIYGWRENRVLGYDRISLSQFEDGVVKGETRLDHGTGLSRPTLTKILDRLLAFGFLIIVEENDPRKKEGACYALQTDPAKIDRAALEQRAEEKREQAVKRTTNARLSPNRLSSVSHTPAFDSLPLSDTEVNPINQSENGGAVSGTNQVRLMPLTGTGKSDLPESVSETNRSEVNATNLQILSRNQEEIKTKTHSPPTPSLSPESSNGDGKAKCVCSTSHGSKLCDEERIRVASNMPGVRSPERYAMTLDARRGTYDSVFLKRKKELDKQRTAPNEPERDISCCPDCHGRGLYYPAGDTPEGRLQGVAKCEHPRLDAELERLEREVEAAKLEMSNR